MLRAPSYELALPRPAWEDAVRRLLVGDGRFAVGRLRWNKTADACRLLNEELAITEAAPAGADRPPLDDWLVLTVGRGDLAAFARELLARIQPRRSQVLVLLILDGDDRRRWEGLVFDTGDVTPLQAFRVTGSSPLVVPRTSPDGLQEPASRVEASIGLVEGRRDESRWSRTEGALGPAVAARVRASDVILNGAGRNGSLLAFQLAALGIRRLRIIDPDTLKIENLDAMPGVTPEDVGRPKAVALARRLVRFRPDLEVTALPHSLLAPEMTTFVRMHPADLLVTAVDNDTPRLAASILCRDTLMTHLDVGTDVRRNADGTATLFGDARLLVSAGAGCVACVGGLADPDQTRYELAAPAGALRRGPPVAWHEQRAGSLITINSLTTASGVQLWLDLLAGSIRTSHWQRLRWEPGGSLRSDGGTVGAAADCRYCRRGTDSI